MSMTYAMGIALAPLFGWFLISLIARPIARLIWEILPDSFLKRILFIHW